MLNDKVKSVINSSSHFGTISNLATEIIADKFGVSILEVREYAEKELRLKIQDRVLPTKSVTGPPPKFFYHSEMDIKEENPLEKFIRQGLN